MHDATPPYVPPHSHDRRHGAGHDHPHAEPHARLGHNAAAREPLVWQLPGSRPGASESDPHAPEPDFDLVEAAFVEGFATASDPTSFLRLAGVPLIARDAGGRSLGLLRVELEQKVDVGALTPLLGGAGLRYDPLPARLVSRRRSLAFVYQVGEGTVRLSLAEARALRAESPAGRDPCLGPCARRATDAT